MAKAFELFQKTSKSVNEKKTWKKYERFRKKLILHLIFIAGLCLAFFIPKLYSTNDFTRLNGSEGVSSSEKGRTPFRKDYARLLHAPSFRRLQGKTQLFPGSESDFFRNRLTHSLEVAQIASGIAERINETETEFKKENIDRDLVQFATLAHDLGHPPFGHNGEKALDKLMKPYGSFEGNA